VKVDIDEASDRFGCLSVVGPDALVVIATATELVPPDQSWRHVGWAGLRILRGDLPDGTPAVDIIGPLDELGAAWVTAQEAGARPAGTDAYEAVRIEAGVPRQGLDIDDKTIPQEAFLERDAVSFTKGCFLGQELVCRIDTRGHVNKYLRGIVVLDAIEPPAGAEVLGENGAVVGSLSSVASSPGMRAPVALATVRREVPTPSLVSLQWPQGVARAELRELPMRPHPPQSDTPGA
jgi:folate-binding protein YgfZ